MRLTADSLSCERNGREIFRGLSFAVAAGECLELRGPNGSGKSTLLRLIAGLVPATTGNLALQDGKADTSIPAQCHYAGHLEAIKTNLTVRENLSFWNEMMDGHGIDAALEAFALFKLADHPALILSAGQRRRLLLARLLLAKRPIWLLDEPATALDTDQTRNLVQRAEAHLEDGGLILVATHTDWGLAPTRVLHLGASP